MIGGDASFNIIAHYIYAYVCGRRMCPWLTVKMLAAAADCRWSITISHVIDHLAISRPVSYHIASIEPLGNVKADIFDTVK